ncbi:unnamed protein product [Mytilus coruscus]|uniref:MULE transposase domain-containing protein n=1 Tax=Mytilus coruscus TaxID=42192 RepID=A0A6J8AAL6_MYTCO|nr:unnamed protein product [Mytilus coruscus]
MCMFPLVYVLLPGNDNIIYSRFFSHIRYIVQLHQLQLQPETVFIDYETETNNATGTVFPGVTLKGCFFHFTQCIWRKAQKCGPQSYYKENEDITQLIQAAVLSLVRPYLVKCTIFQYSAGGACPPKRRRYKVIDTSLQLLKDRYLYGHINVIDYSVAASHLLHLN